MSKVFFWNTADLSPPPENFCAVQISSKDLSKLRNTFQNATKSLKALKVLDLEAALLSRLIWKSKSKFHADKTLHRLEAVNRGLLKYLALNIVSVYKTFGSRLLDIQRKKQDLPEAVLPSRQMLEWVLVRTQGFARLFCYLAHNCEEAAKAWIDPLTRGFVFTISPIVLGVLSRIWTIVKCMIVNACQWYTELLPFRLTLKSVGLRWLPSDYKLPENLTEWINMPHITNAVKKEEAGVFRLTLMQHLMSADNEEMPMRQTKKQKSLRDFLDESDNEDGCKLSNTNTGNSKKSSLTQEINDSLDIGTFVVRKTNQVEAETSVSKTKKRKKPESNVSSEKQSASVKSEVQCASPMKKKKVKHLPEKSHPTNIADKPKIGKTATVSIKKKKSKTINSIPNAEIKGISVKEQSNPGVWAVTEKKKKKNVCKS